MTRIACLVDTISRSSGGLSSSVRGLLSGIQNLGNEVYVISISDKYSEEDKKEWSQFDINLVQPLGPRKLGFAPNLSEVLAHLDVDVLHSQGLWTYTSYACLKWKRQTRRPTIIHPHGMLDPWALNNSRWKKQLAMMAFEGQNLKEAVCIRALCQSEKESVRVLGLKNPVCVIPNGIDLPPLEATDSGALYSSCKILLYLGRLHPKKGLEQLIQAWAMKLKDSNFSSWTLLIAGWDQSGHEDDLKRLATKLSIAWSDLRDQADTSTALRVGLENPPPLVFAGPAFGLDKERLYRACEAFILPSFSEGLPMVVLEAWSYSKPVVMTPMCNLPEGFATGSAISIEPKVNSIQVGLGTLINLSENERAAIGQRGRRLVEDRFAWPKVAAQMQEVNDWVVKGGGEPECVEL